MARLVLTFLILVAFVAIVWSLYSSKKMRSDAKKFEPFDIILQEQIKRTKYLEQGMDELFREHKTIDKLTNAYDLINKYVECRDKTEEDYCKAYLRKKYSSEYKKYDDERL